jgi:hypothetical protein
MKRLTLLSIAALMAGSSLAQNGAPKINVDWWFDLYHQHDFGRPGTGDFVNGRGIDIANKRAELAFAQVGASMAPAPWGFTLQVYAGRGPELIHLAEPGGMNNTKNIRQAYVTYAVPGLSPRYGGPGQVRHLDRLRGH